MFDDFIGIPFQDGGRTKAGCDCWGLVRLVYSSLGVEVPDYKISCFASSEVSDAVEENRYKWHRILKPVTPCLVTLKLAMALPGFVTHLGVYVGYGKFLHTMKKRNSAIEKITHPFYNKRIEGFYEFRN